MYDAKALGILAQGMMKKAGEKMGCDIADLSLRLKRGEYAIFREGSQLGWGELRNLPDDIDMEFQGA